MKRWLSSLLLLLSTLGLNGCGAPPVAGGPPIVQGTIAPSLTATATARPPSTATVTPSATPSPSATPNPSVTPSPSATPLPTESPRPTAWPTPDGPLTQEERVLLFDELWKLVNERYIDPGFNGVNWAAEREFRRPRALAAPDDASYYLELKEMVWTLDDSHSRFMTPNEASEHFALTRNEVRYGGFGLYTMPAPGGALVLQVEGGSPAARAGLQPCDLIVALDGRAYGDDRGTPGTSGTLTVQRPGGERFVVPLVREEVTQVLDVPGTVLPGREGRIGYVRIDTLWVSEMPERLRERLAELEQGGPLDGLIIDLRSNLGGWRPVLQGILGTFVAGELGEFSGRLQSDPLVSPRQDDPPPSHPDLPLVVLVGPRTESYAEVLAAVLQASRGAIVIGSQTQGNVETIFPRRLPFSARVWIAEQGFRLASGATLEGIGVAPDVVDRTDWTQYACARDPQVEMGAILLENRP